MRQHIGFDRLWAMQIPVPYSLFLRDGTFGWSCGQCPLDRSGAVVSPGDAGVQAKLVASYCQTILAEAGFAIADLCMAVIYHDAPDPAPVLAILREAFGPAPLLVPVRVPVFYYAGMQIEVDLFAVAGGPAATTITESGTTVSAKGLTFLHGKPGLLTRTPLIDHWIAAAGAGLPSHAIIEPLQREATVWAVLPDEIVTETAESHLRLRRAGSWLAVTATAPDIPGLVPQTEAIMETVAKALTAHGLTFRDVVKSTTHYVGAPTAAELHDNMAVRNRRYAAPGPASTGIRVAALADPRALTAISLLLCRNR